MERAIKSACVLIRIPDCVSHVITLRPRTDHVRSTDLSSFLQRGYFLPLSYPLFNHRARARARPPQIKTACRDLLRGPGQNGRSVARVCERRRKNGKALRGAPKRAFIKMHARTASRIATITIMAFYTKITSIRLESV